MYVHTVYNCKLVLVHFRECSMALIVRTIIPDYQNTNIKKILLKWS